MGDENFKSEGRGAAGRNDKAREVERRDDLIRSREYSDSFRKYLVAAITGAIGLLFAIAGSLLDNHVSPKWIVIPISIFLTALFCVGIALLFGEHRSLLRRNNPKAQDDLPWWKLGITWNLVPLGLFVLGVVLSVIALNKIEVKVPDQKCPPQDATSSTSVPQAPKPIPAKVVAPPSDQAAPNKSAPSNEAADKTLTNTDSRPAARDKQ